jgi:hypothetical protein
MYIYCMYIIADAVVSWRGNSDGGMNGFGGMKYPPPVRVPDHYPL